MTKGSNLTHLRFRYSGSYSYNSRPPPIPTSYHHSYSSHGDVLACLPKVDQVCRKVMREVTVFETETRCYDFPKIECEDGEDAETMKMTLCTSEYEMDKKHTTATVS